MRLTAAAFLAAILAGGPISRADDTPKEPSRQEEFWSHVKDMRAGPLTFDFGGQVRLRYEHQDGYTLKGYAPGENDQLLLSRVRLDLATRFWDRPLIFLQLQDARAFLTRYGPDDFPVSNPIEDTLDIRQLYAEWLKIGDSPFGFRVGRQQISYGDQRVFGPGNWGNTGRFAWDAAMLKLDTEWLATDLWLGRYLTYQSHIWPNRPVEDFLTFVNYTQVKMLPFRLDLFHVLKYDSSGTVEGESGTGNLLAHTVGIQAAFEAGGILDGGGTFAFQFGRHGRDTLRAFGANAGVGATAPASWRPRLGVQYTWGSGDSDPEDGVRQTFDGVFGGRDVYFYGYQSRFFWANLRDAEINFSVRPWRGLSLHLDYHRFRLDQARDAWYSPGLAEVRRDVSGLSGTDLGDEIGARAVLDLWGHLELMTGYARFFPGAFVRATGPAEQAGWYFAQAAYSW